MLKMLDDIMALFQAHLCLITAVKMSQLAETELTSITKQ